MANVLIEIRGGVAEVTYKDEGINLYIVDYDNNNIKQNYSLEKFDENKKITLNKRWFKNLEDEWRNFNV